VGSPKVDPLLRALETPARVWEADDAWFREIGFNETERKALCNKSLEPAARILKLALNNNGWVLTPDDALYPDCLRDIYALPLVLYGRGEWPEWDMCPVLAVVGTREPTVYGWETAWHLASGTAASGMTIVSGGALGIDAAAHQGALDAGGCTGFPAATLHFPSASHPAASEAATRTPSVPAK